MKRVLTAAILIPVVILALFKAPLWLFTLLVFGVALLAAHRYFGIVRRGDLSHLRQLATFSLRCRSGPSTGWLSRRLTT